VFALNARKGGSRRFILARYPFLIALLLGFLSTLAFPSWTAKFFDNSGNNSGSGSQPESFEFLFNPSTPLK
jgi:hypothetical protein